MAAAGNIVVAVVGVDALEDEAAVELVDANAAVAVDKLVDAHAAQGVSSQEFFCRARAQAQLKI